MSGDLGLIGGVLMGLAASLHCAGVCGGVASSLLLASAPASASGAAQGQALLAAQLGRATTYTVFGALAGLGGAGFSGLLELAGAQAVLRGLGGAALILSGLSIAGLAPSVAGADRIIGGALRRVSGPSRRRATTPYALGLAWGLAPCGMVYAALTNAMLSGSALGGATFMAGFGLATAPAVAAAAFGARTLAGLGIRARGQMRLALGLTLACLGALSLVEPAMALSALCLRR